MERRAFLQWLAIATAATGKLSILDLPQPPEPEQFPEAAEEAATAAVLPFPDPKLSPYQAQLRITRDHKGGRFHEDYRVRTLTGSRNRDWVDITTCDDDSRVYQAGLEEVTMELELDIQEGGEVLFAGLGGELGFELWVPRKPLWRFTGSLLSMTRKSSGLDLSVRLASDVDIRWGDL